MLGTMQPTTDGGMIAAGYYVSSGGDPLYQGNRAWILKLDSNACEVDNCWVGTNPLNPPKGDFLKVFPNPTNGILSIEISESLSEKRDVRAVITNILGQIQKTLSLYQAKTTIDTNNFPNGVYVVSIYQNNDLLGSKRVVVQHE